MSTRKIKDIIDLETNELVYPKTHAKATFMSDGSTVEDAINAMGSKKIVDIDVVATDVAETKEVLPNIPVQYLPNIVTNKTFVLSTADMDTTKENLWKISFIIGSTAPSISITSAVTIYWANGIAPSFDVNSYYEITFKYLNGYLLGVCGMFK
jgi:hypothetical protein